MATLFRHKESKELYLITYGMGRVISAGRNYEARKYNSMFSGSEMLDFDKNSKKIQDFEPIGKIHHNLC